MQCYEYECSHGRFGLKITDLQVRQIAEYCKRAKNVETGGILIGYYTEDLKNAMVTRVEGPPDDSQFGRYWFYRGVRGLHLLLKKLWQDHRQYYLGEWHFHPGGSVIPSGTDIDQMNSIVKDSKWNCPEPLMLIMGEKEKIGAYVFTKSEKYVELQLK